MESAGQFNALMKLTILYLMARVAPLSFSVLSILIIANTFSPVEQGHFFLLLNFISAQSLFEAGLLYQVMQRSSALSAKKASYNEILCSPVFQAFQYKAFLAIVVVSTAYVVFISLVAMVMFWRQVDSPSILSILGLIMAVAIRLICAAFEYLIEGLGHKTYAVSSRIFFSSMSGIMLCVLLWFGYGLNALALSYSFTLLSLIILHLGLSKYKPIHITRLGYVNANKFSWRDNMLETQKRMLVTWIFGFAAFQSTVPIIYLVSGPELAGKYGLLLTAAGAIKSVALFPLSRSSPDFGRLMAQNQIISLRQTVKSLSLESFVYVTGMLVVLLLVLYFFNIPHFGINTIADKIPSVIPTLCVLVAIYLQLAGMIIAQVIRASNVEPFRKSSLFIGLGMIFTVFLSAMSPYPDILVGISILLVWLVLGVIYPVKVAIPHLNKIGILEA